MTTSEAVRVYDQLRTALQSLDPQQEVTARNELIQAHALASHESVHIASAIAAFRIIFRKLDDGHYGTHQINGMASALFSRRPQKRSGRDGGIDARSGMDA